MPVLTWISGTLLMLHFAHSNVLLKANLGDLNGMMSVAKHLVQAPVFDEISKIWQRASHQFQNQYYKELAKIKSEKQMRPKHNFDMDYEGPAKHRSQPNRQFKERKPKRSSHDRVNDYRRQGGVNERLNESISDDRPSQGDLDQSPSESDDDKRPSQGDVNERPSKSKVDKEPSQGVVNERQSKGNDDKRHSPEVSHGQDNVADDFVALGKNASSYLKSINKIFENL